MHCSTVQYMQWGATSQPRQSRQGQGQFARLQIQLHRARGIARQDGNVRTRGIVHSQVGWAGTLECCSVDSHPANSHNLHSAVHKPPHHRSAPPTSATFSATSRCRHKLTPAAAAWHLMWSSPPEAGSSPRHAWQHPPPPKKTQHTACCLRLQQCSTKQSLPNPLKAIPSKPPHNFFPQPTSATFSATSRCRHQLTPAAAAGSRGRADTSDCQCFKADCSSCWQPAASPVCGTEANRGQERAIGGPINDNVPWVLCRCF